MNWAGAEASPDELAAQIYLAGRRGTLQTELLAAARHHGLLAYVHEPSVASLLRQIDAGQPVLVLQNLAFERLPLWHYAVVVGYDLNAGSVLLRSGTTKRQVMSLRRFERSWRRGEYWALTLHAPGNLPAHADAARFLAAAADLEEVGQLDAAYRAYQAASETWPNDPGSWLGRGNIHYRKGQYRAAAELYRQGLEQDPSEAALHHNLAWVYLRLGDHARARPHAERAQRLDSTDDGRYGGALEQLTSHEQGEADQR